MAGIQDILRPVTITKVVSRIASSTNTLLNFFGMEPGGRNERIVGGRDASYDVFNNVRTIGKATAPGTSASKRARNPIGRVPFTFPRMHESTWLLAEEVSNLRRIGGPSAERDLGAQDFLRRQMVPPAQRAANFRTAMLAGMLRNSLYAGQSGADWYLSFTSSGSLFQINSQIPTGNFNQLNMQYQEGPNINTSIYGAPIIDVSWDNSSANIPKHLTQINDGILKSTGLQLNHVIIPYDVWNYIINNDYVASQAGVAGAPFETFERKVGEGPDGQPINEQIGRIKAVPWIEFHIRGDVLELGAEGSETSTALLAAGTAIFCPTPASTWCEMLLGSEPIAEYDGGPWQQKVGLASWTKTSFNPTGWEIFTLDNCLPVFYVPGAICYGTVVFTGAPS